MPSIARRHGNAPEARGARARGLLLDPSSTNVRAPPLKVERRRADNVPMGKDRLSWLCRDEQARERLLDMDRRLRGARSAALGVLAIALVAVGHWEGWWTLAVLTIAFAGFAATAPFVHRVSHPEYVMAGAWGSCPRSPSPCPSR